MKVAESRLEKRCAALKRVKGTFSLSDAREIGVIFNASDPVNLEGVKKFVAQLQELNPRIFVIGYVNDKKVNDISLLRSGFNYFTLKNLSWFLKPVSPFIDEFLNRHFDILFDLDLDNLYPLKYIASLSKAGMRVGRFFEECDYLDFMIKTDPEQSVAFLIEQAMYYLNMVRKPESV